MIVIIVVGFLIWYGIHCLRLGYVVGRGNRGLDGGPPRFYREDNPRAFWIGVVSPWFMAAAIIVVVFFHHKR